MSEPIESGKVAIVGDTISVAGFRPLGFAVFPVERPEEARGLWPELMSGSFSAVFLTEPVYEELEDLTAKAMDSPLPAITVIPGVGVAQGLGGAKLKWAIEKALGTSTLIREEEE